jgi:hypothetical protein
LENIRISKANGQIKFLPETDSLFDFIQKPSDPLQSINILLSLFSSNSQTIADISNRLFSNTTQSIKRKSVVNPLKVEILPEKKDEVDIQKELQKFKKINLNVPKISRIYLERMNEVEKKTHA